MRIALVVHHVRPTGGQDRYALELARALAERHEVHVYAVRVETDARTGAQTDRGTDGRKGFGVQEIPLPDRPLLRLAPRFAREVGRRLARERFDIVHAVGGCLPGASVITAQFCHAAWHRAKRRYRVREGGPLREAYLAVVRRQAIRFDRAAYHHPALRAVIAVSRRMQSELVRHYGVGIERITVVPNGVDPEGFAPERHPDAREALRAELCVPPNARIALLVGTYARKGLDTACAAVARAAPGVHLVVAGSGDARWAHRVAAAGGLENRLHLLGPRREVARLFAAADLFVLPTRYEPFGMVIVEAMAAGLPVVVSGIAGAAEWIADGQTGFVVADPDDAAGFAGAIRAVLEDPARAAAVGRAARAAARAVAWEAVVRQTEAVYRRVAG
jgi:glycosyltransferase involved in cell wall biosynthesis